MSKKMMQEFMLYMPAKLFEGLVGFALLSIYTWILPDSFGRYGLMNTFMMTAYLVLFGWLMHASNRHIASIEEREKTPFISTVLTTWVGLQFAYIALVIMVYIGVAQWRSWLLVSIVMFTPLAAVQLLTPMMTFTKHVRASIALSAGTLGAKFVLVLLLYRWFDPWWTIVVVHSLVDLTASVLVLWQSGYLKYWKFNAWSYPRFKGLWHYGMPLMGLGIAMAVTSMSGRFLINLYHGDIISGIYQYNYTVASTVFTLLQVSVMRAANPNIIAQYKQNPDGIEHSIWQGLRLFWMLALPSAAGISLLAGQILERIVEKEYIVGYSIIGWVALGMLVLGTAEYFVKPLELSKNTKPALHASIWSAVVNLGLNIALIPSMGYEVAAIATMIGYFIYGGYILVVVLKKHRIFIDKLSVFRLTLATTLMALAVLALRGWISSWWQLGATIFMAIIIYFGTLLTSGELNQEKTMLKHVVMNRRK